MSTTHDTPSSAAPAPPPPPPAAPRPSAGRPPAGRGWWRALGSLFAVAVLSMAVLQILGLLGHSTETIRRSVPVEGIEAIDVDASSGEVLLTGTSGDEVRIEARVEHGLWRTKVRIERDGTTLRARSSCPPFPGRCGVRYTVEVPRGVRVVARSDNGDVRARDLRGPAVLESSNGEVQAANLSGPALLTSSNGDVTAAGMQGESIEARSDNGAVSVDVVEAPDRLVAESDNGDVDVAVPDDGTAYALDLFTDNGTASGDIRTDPGADRSLRIRSDNGDVSVRYRLR